MLLIIYEIFGITYRIKRLRLVEILENYFSGLSRKLIILTATDALDQLSLMHLASFYRKKFNLVSFLL